MAFSGAINCQNGPVSGAINCQNGRQILYVRSLHEKVKLKYFKISPSFTHDNVEPLKYFAPTTLFFT
jgi:hypothetical protein